MFFYQYKSLLNANEGKLCEIIVKDALPTHLGDLNGGKLMAIGGGGEVGELAGQLAAREAGQGRLVEHVGLQRDHEQIHLATKLGPSPVIER